MEKIKLRKAVQQRNSAEVVASIDDLLTEILVRLPIKSLIRFESVSKNWQSLITSPRFRHLRSRTIGLMLPRVFDIPEGGRRHEYVPFFKTALTRKIGYPKDVDLGRVLQSCNGLLLCVRYFGRERRFYVSNPSTNQLSFVPPQPKERNLYMHKSLVFDPTMSPHYKVVCVRTLRNRLTQILIYSSETGAWEFCGDPFTSFDVKLRNGVYWNGAVHWMCSNRHLYFKIEDQVLNEMPKVPFSIVWNCRDRYYFGESGDHLHFVETSETKIQLNIYELKRDYSEWFVKYRVDLSPVITAYPEMIRGFNNPTTGSYFYNFSVFCIVRGDEEEFLVLQIPRKVIRLNLNRNTFIALQELESSQVFGDSDVDESQDELKYQHTYGFQYIESLWNV